MFARRASWDLAPNALSRAIAERRAGELPLLDLSDANPTRAGLAAPGHALAAALAELARDPAALRYEPDARGDATAREAVAALHRRAGASPDAAHVLLTAGTSDGYAQLFRVLADPGERVHVPTPGYPLFEHLAALEGLETASYRLLPPAAGARWRIDVESVAAGLSARSRAVLLIHPHNPTGSFVDPEDLAALRSLCRERRMALISDEVFADPGEPGAAPPGALAGAAQAGPLTFVLSGASKLLALPQLKLAWIVAAGPAALRDEALARLEFAADAFLAVSPLLARLLPTLLAQRELLQRELRARLASNRAALGAALAGCPGAELLPAEAGWAAIVRTRGAPLDEEAFALALLERAGVLVQPGFWFDLPDDHAGAACAHFVLSLLLEPPRFARGAAALAEGLARANS